jgi:hypothetical protein
VYGTLVRLYKPIGGADGLVVVPVLAAAPGRLTVAPVLVVPLVLAVAPVLAAGSAAAAFAAEVPWSPDDAAELAAVRRALLPGPTAMKLTAAATTTTAATVTEVQRLLPRMDFKASVSACDSRPAPPGFRSDKVGPFWLSVARLGHSLDGPMVATEHELSRSGRAS